MDDRKIEISVYNILSTSLAENTQFVTLNKEFIEVNLRRNNVTRHIV